MQSLGLAKSLLRGCLIRVHCTCAVRPQQRARFVTLPGSFAARSRLVVGQKPLSRKQRGCLLCTAASPASSASDQQIHSPQWPSRDALCGQQNLESEGRRLALCGWVHRARNMGGIVFADLRDHTGILQVCTLLLQAPLSLTRKQITQ